MKRPCETTIYAQIIYVFLVEHKIENWKIISENLKEVKTPDDFFFYSSNSEKIFNIETLV